MHTERRDYKQGKTVNSMDERNKDIRRQIMDSDSSGQKLLKVCGRVLRSVVDLIRLMKNKMMMMIMAIM